MSGNSSASSSPSANSFQSLPANDETESNNSENGAINNNQQTSIVNLPPPPQSPQSPQPPQPPQPPLPPFYQIYRPKLQKFNGHDKSVTIENWLKLYESSAQRYHWTKDEMIDLLGEYLEREALNFYLDSRDDTDWPTLKGKLIIRFGVKSVDPIVEFDRLKYHQTSGIEDYFETKRRLAGLSSLNESQAVALMIEHLSDELKRYFIGHRAKTYCEFYAIAKTAENQLPKRDKGNNQMSSFGLNSAMKNKKQTNQNFTNQNKKPPKGACFRCANQGKPNQIHWANDCPLRKDPTVPKQVNFINDTSSSSTQDENDLN